MTGQSRALDLPSWSEYIEAFAIMHANYLKSLTNKGKTSRGHNQRPKSTQEVGEGDHRKATTVTQESASLKRRV